MGTRGTINEKFVVNDHEGTLSTRKNSQKRNGKQKFLEGCLCCAESTQPLIGCLSMDIVCQGQCSNQSEARIQVMERYRILTGENPGNVTLWLTCIHQSEADFIQRDRNSTPEIPLAIFLWRKKTKFSFQTLNGCCSVNFWNIEL